MERTCNYNLAVCLEKTGRHKEALGSFRKALEIDPKRAETGIGEGVSLLYLKRYSEAVTAFETCLETNPGTATALFGRAFALQCASRHAEAEAAYLEALERSPEQREILLNLIHLGATQNAVKQNKEH